MTETRHDFPSPCAEMNLLLACLSPGPDVERVEESLSAADMDWPRVLELATHHHVIPLVHRALKAAAAKRPAGAVPREYLDYLRRMALTIAAFNLRASVTLERLQRDLREKGIRLIPIKGPALAVLAHGSTSMRQFEDLDLLVNREDLLRALDFFEREGYVLRELPPGIDRNRYLGTLQDWSLIKAGAPPLDLKPVLISHTLSGTESIGYMQASCREREMGEGQRLESPDPEAMLLAVCVDGSNDMWMKLSAVADAAHLLAGHPDADWEGLLRDAARLGHRRCLLAGAQLTEILLGLPLPAAFRLAVDKPSQRLAEQAAAMYLRPAAGYPSMVCRTGYALRSRDGWSRQLHFAMRLLFVPGPMEWALFSARGLHPMGSFIRPLRLAWNAFIRGGRPQRLDIRAAAPVHGTGGRGA